MLEKKKLYLCYGFPSLRVSAITIFSFFKKTIIYIVFNEQPNSTDKDNRKINTYTCIDSHMIEIFLSKIASFPDQI